MSRGPGKWQRAILEAIVESEHGWVYPHKLAPREITIAGYRVIDQPKHQAILRAAHRLAELGKVEIFYTGHGWRTRLIAAKPGALELETDRRWGGLRRALRSPRSAYREPNLKESRLRMPLR